MLAPVTILVSAIAFALSWSTGGNPILAGCPLATVVAAEAFTLVYFMPINRGLFFDPVEDEPGALTRALTARWERANIARLAIVAAGVVAGFAAVIQAVR